ncbi:AraC family transcriptional regulator [Parapedobacter pyrenivorans]|uniref:AraC family transcriptional regulator n=1 Tax=Parapedobacter pyrenivorans TaxID=1305674 RepID=UPI003340C99C
MHMIATAYHPKVYLYRRVVQAKLFIDSNYSEKIDLDGIAGEAYFSKFHFIRLFKSIYGKTPHHYLKHLRIAQAKVLLAQNLSITETCFAVGFESLSSFSTLFTTIVGQSPSAYSKRHQQTKQRISKNPHAFVPGCYAYQHGWFENSNFEEVGD